MNYHIIFHLNDGPGNEETLSAKTMFLIAHIYIYISTYVGTSQMDALAAAALSKCPHIHIIYAIYGSYANDFGYEDILFD